MKKLLPALMLAAVLFSACTPPGGVSSAIEENDKVSQTSQISSAPPQVLIEDGKGQLEDCKIEILSAELTEDYLGEPCIVVTYEWSHEKEDSTSFYLAFSDKVFQNGIECDITSMGGENTYLKEIKPGTVFQTKIAYVPQDLEAEIEVEVKPFLSHNKDKVTKMFSL